MSDVFFYLFSTLTLAAALLVVTNRNAVTSAMFLIVTFLGMASLFVLLEAYFLAVIQVLVYAGAVVVLFLFIIMLLDVKGHTVRPRLFTFIASTIALCLLLVGLAAALKGGGLASTAVEGPASGSNLKAFGVELFTTYLLPMQVTGFLLLVAMIGVIVLSKRTDAKPVAALSATRASATTGALAKEVGK
jgi:NADH-quinone oxidoreductase subunit J